MLAVRAVAVLDDGGGITRQTESLLRRVAAELALDEDGRLRHLLVVDVLQGGRWLRGGGRHAGAMYCRALASDALYRYCNAILKNCNAIFDFQITLFSISNNAIFRF